MQPNKPLRIFAALQALDFATTLLALHFGGCELNSLVAALFPLMGPVAGLALAKLSLVTVAALAAKLNKHRALRLANVVYTGIVLWNLQIIYRLLGGIA